jgi:2-C-methyl-D-erythritol 4-phosphate cytidylyltransferase
MTDFENRPVLIVLAGGSGQRYGGDKLLAPVGGRPVVAYPLANLAPAAKRTVLVVPAGREEEFRRVAEKYAPRAEILVVAGGATRFESVRCGLAAASSLDDELVAVHDAARPLATTELLRELCRRAREVGGAVPGFPQSDAQKRVDANGVIAEDLPREGVWNVGTPQVFRAELLKRACREADTGVLDDAEAVRRAGGTVAVVRSDAPNPKLTAPGDLHLIEVLRSE